MDRNPGSYWLETAPGKTYAPLGGGLDVDVVVVVAGIAGVSTAWEFTRRGRRVTVPEAGRVVGGVTGRRRSTYRGASAGRGPAHAAA
jgi:glycine/D-amino acid oxidase-like deaminating enzyme